MKAALLIPDSTGAHCAAPAERERDGHGTVPHILHIDQDADAAKALATLLVPEARVTHVPTLAGARQLLEQQVFSAVVIDPNLPDGNAVDLLPALAAMPLLVYSASQPAWRERAGVYLPKPWATQRQLWTTISQLLGIASPSCAGGCDDRH